VHRLHRLVTEIVCSRLAGVELWFLPGGMETPRAFAARWLGTSETVLAPRGERAAGAEQLGVDFMPPAFFLA
jgi:hypothetical protein